MKKDKKNTTEGSLTPNVSVEHSGERALPSCLTATECQNTDDYLKLIHQLQERQIELEKQNKELQLLIEKTTIGNKQECSISAFDVTDCKLTETVMHESMQLFQGLFNVSPDAIILIDPHHPTISWPIVNCNTSACLMNGYKKEELVGHSIDILNTTQDSPKERAEYFKNLQQKGTLHVETYHRHKDRHIFPVEVLTTIVTLGERELVLEIDRDITEKKMAEEVTREAEERFRMVFENVFDGIVIYEEYPDLSERKLIDCNEQYAAMAGLTREEMLKLRNTNHIQKSLEESSDKVRIESLTSRKAFRGSYTWIRPDGKDNIIEFIGVPVIWRGKTYAIGIDRDITERKKVESELIAAKEKAEESDLLKSAFLANMSHEIRTPLNSIIGFSELLADPEFDLSQLFRFARMINESGNNLLSIITDILDISKIETGQHTIRTSQVSINKLIAEIKKEFTFRAIKKGIELRLDRSNPIEEIFIESDETKLKQVLVNLLSNSIKFTKEGLIVIGFKLSGDFIQFHVKDTGIGIAKEFYEQIFERFHQVESAFTKKYPGNGLGLAISKGLVELLGGTIWIESEQGKGSSFYFTIPKK